MNIPIHPVALQLKSSFGILLRGFLITQN
jgi:hypothetical protein